MKRKDVLPLRYLKKRGLKVYPLKSKITIEHLLGKENIVPLINKKIKIVSMGSCFARIIKYWLVRNGYNYLQTETGEKYLGTDPTIHEKAGRI